jgi:hypothetical protein
MSLVFPLLDHLSEMIGQPASQSLEMNHRCIELHFVLTYTECAFKLWYCNKFAGSISQWKFITLKAQYTTVEYSSQHF